MLINVYCDGSCSNTLFKGIGGWAYLITGFNIRMENSGTMIDTTNNRMEIEAVIQGLKQLVETKHLYPEGSEITIFSDSELVIRSLSEKWQQKKNYDKWYELINLINDLTQVGFIVKAKWVKAHDKDQLNIYVDKLATDAKKKLINQIIQRVNTVYISTLEKEIVNGLKRI